MELSDTEFVNLRSHIRKICGLHINEEKKYLVRQRLEPLAEELGCKTFTQLYMRLIDDPSEALQEKVTLAMTTNETSFFRDKHPFESFKTHILPELTDAFLKQRKAGKLLPSAKLNLYCAASSSGQEPYTIGMCIHEYVRTNRFLLGVKPEDFSLVSTDIDQKMLDQASAARYNVVEIKRGLSEDLRDKYFVEEGGSWVAKPELRSLCSFKRLNLMESFSHLGRFYVIFCRNVLIYFDEETKRKIIRQFHQMLHEGGYLFLGSSENLYCMSDGFETVRIGPTVVYKKIGK